MGMAAAVIVDATSPDVRCDRNGPAVPPALRMAARSFRRLSGVDVVWLAVRESRSQTAVIRCSEGARSAPGLGFKIEPGVGVGGALLLTGEPWRGELTPGRASSL